METDEFVKECMKREHDETFREWKKQVLINSHQPERLNPEGEECNVTLPIGYEEGMEPYFTFDVCDSLIPENK